MVLLPYQTEVLDTLSSYLAVLAEEKAKASQTNEVLKATGSLSLPIDVPGNAWTKATRITPTHHPFIDARAKAVPNVCLQVPTGGGKTLLAAHAIERILRIADSTTTGLVLWLVPSDAILKQTYAALNNRNHPYRVALKCRLCRPREGAQKRRWPRARFFPKRY